MHTCAGAQPRMNRFAEAKARLPSGEGPAAAAPLLGKDLGSRRPDSEVIKALGPCFSH